MNKSIRKIVATLLLFFFTFNYALAGNIDSTDKWAWGSQIGWINFGTTNGNVTVAESGVTGYAWSTMYGWINLDPSMAGVTNTCDGDLAGYAWSGMFGYISFSGAIIDANGYFQGKATTQFNGDIVFSGSTFKLKTSWKPTCSPSGTFGVSNVLSGSYINDNTPLINGTGATPGSQVIITGPNGQSCSSIADGSGNWGCSMSGSLIDGPNTLSATEILSSGTANPSFPLTLNIDTLQPLSPVVISLSGDTTSPYLTNSANPSLTGTGEIGSIIQLTSSTGVVLGTGLVDGSGNWNITPSPSLPEGSQSLNIVSTDAAGNISPVNSISVIVDTISPTVPTIGNPTNGLLTNDNTPTINGTGEPGSTFVIKSSTGSIIGTGTVDGGGNYSFTPSTALPDGSNTLNITVIDSAGNESSVASVTFSIDTLAPTPLTVITPINLSTTNDNTPTVTGSGEVNSVFEIRDASSSLLGTGLVDAGGNYSFTPSSALPDGSNTYSVTLYDGVNTSSPVTTVFTVDTVIPVSPSVTSVSGDSSAPYYAPTATPAVIGTSEPGALITLQSSTGVVIGTGYADGSGNWTIVPSSLPIGSQTIDVKQTDLGGNTSSLLSITIDIGDGDIDNDGLSDVTDGDIDGDGIINIFDTDVDGDGTANSTDTDDDGDGIDDGSDSTPTGLGIPSDVDGDGVANIFDTDTDGDGIANSTDTDDDGDGTADGSDSTPTGAGTSTDIDGDGTPNDIDTDVDGDGILNTVDGDIDGDGILNASDSDMDGDGVANIFDTDVDGDGIANSTDTDDDGDGTADGSDSTPTGLGIPSDVDGDGVANIFDTDTDGDGIANSTDTDDDGDGTADGSDSTPTGAGTSTDIDGDGTPNDIDTDVDGDAVANIFDTDTDGDGIANSTDTDDDEDGTADGSDSTPTGVGTLTDIDGDGIINIFDTDVDGDGTANSTDTDDDGDGIDDGSDSTPTGLGIPSDVDGDGVANIFDTDTDGDGIANSTDTDDDGDGTADGSDSTPTGAGTSTDIDGDGTPNDIDTDVDGDGILNTVDGDIDGDGILNASDSDMDGDGVANIFDTDTDGDGIANSTDTDDDGDGTADGSDSTPTGVGTLTDIDGDGVANIFDTDVDGDGIANSTDTDDDGDGIADGSDTTPTGVGTLSDVDGDGVANIYDTDVDGDGIANSTDTDDDGDGIADGSDSSITGDGSLTDVDGDGTPNSTDTDIDGDGFSNTIDTDMDGDGDNNIVDTDTDADGTPNTTDSDDDNDGTSDSSDATPQGPVPVVIGTVGGDSSAPFSTNDSTPTIVGTSAPNSIIYIKDSIGTILATGSVNSSGNYSITLPVTLVDASYPLTFESRNGAGVLLGSDSLTITIDTVAPQVPVVGTPVNGGLYSQNIQFTGSGEIGSTVVITTSTGVVLGTGIVDSGGNWSIIPMTSFTPGFTTVLIHSTDSAGNISSDTSKYFDVSASSGLSGSSSSGSGGGWAGSSNVDTKGATTKTDFVNGQTTTTKDTNTSSDASSPSDTSSLSTQEDQSSSQDSQNSNNTLDSQESITTKTINGTEKKYVLRETYTTCSTIDNLNNDMYQPDYITHFADLDDTDYVDDVIQMEKVGVIDGDSDSLFQPKRSITRAEFLKVLLRSHCYDYSEQSVQDIPFTDVDTTSWQAKVIAKGLSLGIISGDSSLTGQKVFRPNDRVSRAEAIKMLINMGVSKLGESYQTSYSDVYKQWYEKYVTHAEYLGIIDPETDNFIYAPDSYIVRDEMIHMTMNLVKLYR